jgi:hypothetical protein
MKPKRIPKAVVKKIFRLLKGGMRPYLVHQQFPQVHPSTIAWFRRWRLKMPPLPRGGIAKNPAARLKARRLRKKGLTYAEIGEVLGVSKQRVHQYLAGYLPGTVKKAAATEPKQLWRTHQYFPETATGVVSRNEGVKH